MSGWMLSLILASIITILALLVNNSSDENNKNKSTYGIKIFVISFVVIYFGWMFLGPDSEVRHEIEIGEAPF
jgi:heme/copper-type cytochrome/quinol oxidase subunit 4